MKTLEDIELTLDKLIENQVLLNRVKKHLALDFEVEALLKTQESLRAHLFFLSDIYEKISFSIKMRLSESMRKRIYQKAAEYQLLSAFTLGSIHQLFQPASFRIRKSRKKRSPISHISSPR
jgi:hypothetical protein